MHPIELPQHTTETAINERAFPGAVVFCARDGDLKIHAAYGTTAYDDAISREVKTNTIYDIASLSKLFTMTAVLSVARELKIDITNCVSRFLPDFEYSNVQNITIRQLLNHTAGLGIEVQTLHETPTESWLQQIVNAELRDVSGNSVKYSCTNYFVLARLIEIWTSQTLDKWIEKNIIAPLEMTHTTFRPLIEYSLEEIAPCEIDDITGEAWHGVAHDEAARVWMREQGSASGNSGLFSTAEDLAKFAQLWLDEGFANGRQIVDARDVRRAFDDTVRAEHYAQGLGWHQNVSSWMSLRAPLGTSGHAGFTGPTLWLTPSHFASSHGASSTRTSSTRCVCIVLNNRVYPSREGTPRFKFHRRVAEWLLYDGERSKSVEGV